MARIAAENPQVDFSVSTPEVDKALADLNAEGMRWYHFKAPLSDVQVAFRKYERAIVSASSPIKQLTLAAVEVTESAEGAVTK